MKKKISKSEANQIKLIKRFDQMVQQIQRTITGLQKKTEQNINISDADPKVLKVLSAAYRTLTKLAGECITLNLDTIAEAVRISKGYTPAQIKGMASGIHEDIRDLLRIIVSTKMRVEDSQQAMVDEEE